MQPQLVPGRRRNGSRTPMIHCLKTNLHCHCDELANPQGKWHVTAYPVSEALALFARKGFRALGITEHLAAPSVCTNAEAARVIAANRLPLLQVRGHEAERGGQHILELFSGDRIALRVLNHPVRTSGAAQLVELASGLAAAGEIDAVELDMLVSDDPAIRSAYEEVRTRVGLPILVNSDFHMNLFDMANHFTVYLCEEVSPEAIFRAIRAGDYVGFYPDKQSWRMQTWCGGSPLAREWMRGLRPRRFSHRFRDFLRMDPPVRLPDMTAEDIEAFHQTRGVLLKDGGLRLLALPERGGRIAGLWDGASQMIDPILNAALDLDSYSEVFEAGYAPFTVLERGPSHVTLERTLSERREFAGVAYRRTIRLDRGAAHLTFARLNRSQRTVRLHDSVRFRFLKDYGAEASFTVASPTRGTLSLPVNYRGVFADSRECRFTAHGDGYAVELSVNDPRLEHLSLWARKNDGNSLAIVQFLPLELPPGAGAEYHLLMQPHAV